jgi:hypothetical protein
MFKTAKPMIKLSVKAVLGKGRLEHLNFGIWICFGFRISDFDF